MHDNPSEHQQPDTTTTADGLRLAAAEAAKQYVTALDPEARAAIVDKLSAAITRWQLGDDRQPSAASVDAALREFAADVTDDARYSALQEALSPAPARSFSAVPLAVLLGSGGLEKKH